jgi:hypothetical protein
MKSGSLKPPGTLWATPGLLRYFFTFLYNQNVGWSGFWWYNIHSKFHENQQIGSKNEMGDFILSLSLTHTHTHTHTRTCARAPVCYLPWKDGRLHLDLIKAFFNRSLIHLTLTSATEWMGTFNKAFQLRGKNSRQTFSVLLEVVQISTQSSDIWCITFQLIIQSVTASSHKYARQ